MVAVASVGSGFLGSMMLAFEPGSSDDVVLRLVLYADAYTFSAVVGIGAALFLVATSIVVLRTGTCGSGLGGLAS